MKIALLLFYLLVGILPLNASFLETIQKKQVIIPKVKAFILSGDGEIPPDYVRKTAKGVEFYRILQDLSKREKHEISQAIEKLTLNKPLTYEMVEKIEQYLSDYYKSNRHVVISTNFCEMGVNDHVAILSILESRVGQIRVTGNKHLSDDYYLESISLRENDPLQIHKIENDLAWIAKEPSKKVSVSYAPGKSYGKTNIEIAIEDKPLVKAQAISDNWGVPTVSAVRLFTEVALNNLLNFDQTLSYRYETSPNIKKIQGHSASYSLSLPSKIEFTSSFNFEKMLPQNGSKTPKNWSASSHYTFPLKNLKAFSETLELGCNWDKINNNLQQGENVISPLYATRALINATYTLSKFTRSHSFSWKTKAFCQPCAIGDSMSREAYDLLKQGASRLFFFLQGSIAYSYVTPWKEMAFSLKVLGQYSPSSLLPLDQLGLGGYSSVRGYREHLINADSGAFARFEMHLPSFSLLKKRQDNSKFFLFVDAGKALSSKLNLLSIGPALRTSIYEYVHGEFDWGFPLLNSESPIGKAYFRLTASY